MNVRAIAVTRSADMVSEAVPSDDLVRRAQQGDVDAFESIYKSNAQAVFAICRRMVHDDAEARDLVQDVFVHAWEKLRSFRAQSSLATWLHRLAVNVVLTHLRSSRRRFNRFTEIREDSRGRSDAARIEAGIDLDSALHLLPQGARTVFVLHDVQGYSHDEISTLTGIAPGTSRSQLFRARRILMAALDL